jgi:hypothetical protein
VSSIDSRPARLVFLALAVENSPPLAIPPFFNH